MVPDIETARTPPVRPRIFESRTRPSRPPGPAGHWLVGCIPELLRDTPGFLTACARQYGDCIEVPVGLRRALLVSHPEFIEQLLVRHNDCFVKNFAFRTIRPVLGNGLILASGTEWKRQRNLVTPTFHRDRILPHCEQIAHWTERSIASWQADVLVDLQEQVMKMILAINARILFGVDLSQSATDVVSSMRTIQECIRIRAVRLLPIPDSIPTPANLRLQRATRRVDQIVYRMISDRRAQPDPPQDLLTSLVNSRDDSSTVTHDRQLRDEIMSLLLASHETTAQSLVWTLLLLSQHPDEEDQLHNELDTVLGGRLPTADDLPALKRTGWIVNESLRLFPPLWLLGREAVKPCTIAGFPVSVGTNVFVSQWVMHRDPRYFDHPEEFRPSRWGCQSTASLPSFVYLPFGAGPRVCVGASLAQIELVMLLATIYRRFSVRLTDQTVLRPQASITLRPRSPVLVRVLPRSPFEKRFHTAHSSPA